MEKPKIKSLKLFRTNGNSEEKILQLDREFDAHGNKVKEFTYSEDGELIEERYWKYNEQQLPVEEKFNFLADEVTEHVQLKYDEKGRLQSSSKRYGAEGDADETSYIYDENGMLIEQRTVDADGEVEHKELMTYHKNLLATHHVYNYDGSLMSSSKFTYNEQGEVIEEIRFSSERNQELKILYDYPVAGKQPDITVYNKKGNIVQRVRNSFDDKNRLIREISETVDVMVNKTTGYYSYDETDQVSEFRIVDKNENLLSKIRYKHNNFNLLSEEIHFTYPDLTVEIKSFTQFFEYEYF